VNINPKSMSRVYGLTSDYPFSLLQTLYVYNYSNPKIKHENQG
jgi:hypothetical protein